MPEEIQEKVKSCQLCEHILGAGGSECGFQSLEWRSDWECEARPIKEEYDHDLKRLVIVARNRNGGHRRYEYCMKHNSKGQCKLWKEAPVVEPVPLSFGCLALSAGVLLAAIAVIILLSIL